MTVLYIRLLTVLLFLSLSLPAQATTRRVEFVQEFNPAAQDLVELWIPTPMEGLSYQKIISRELTGNATSVQVIGRDDSPAPLIYVRWEHVKKPTFKVVNVLEVQGRDGPSAGLADDKFLRATAHVQTDGIVKETADTITKGLKDPDQKAKAIYDWIVNRTVRDPNVRGCGLGDVKSLLVSGNLRGKCADLNSLFVGLARSAGIPAREVFGQRVAPSDISPSLGKAGDNSKAQHCRAEYYSVVKKAWVPVDPADVRKVMLEEKLAADDPKVAKIRERLFGSWEGTWVAFNYARDFQLPGYDAKNVNYFMYPLLAAGSFRPDGVDPEESRYTFKSTVK